MGLQWPNLEHIEGCLNMDDNEEELQGKINKTIRKACRPAMIDRLFETNEGKEEFERLLMLLSSRASLRAGALSIGISPATLTGWIRRGKKEPESYYGTFLQRVSVAISIAVVDAEIEIGQQDPKFYLQYGAGKIVVNDLYNLKANGEIDYGLDGSIAPTGQNPAAIDSQVDPIDSQTDAIETNNVDIDDVLAIEAIESMRNIGVEILPAIDSDDNSTDRE